MISLLCPSRGRPVEFHRMARSAFWNASGNIEVIGYLDDDDPARDGYVELLGIQFITGPQILLSQAWNECYVLAQGPIYMHCGDDIVFRTRGWDKIVQETFDASEDKLILVHGDDCSPNTDALATHGFLHQRWVETVGYFVPPLFSSDWNDVWLTEVADAIGRRIKVPIVTEHLHYQFQKAAYDRTYQERELRGARDDVVSLYQSTRLQRDQDVLKLRAALAA